MASISHNLSMFVTLAILGGVWVSQAAGTRSLNELTQSLPERFEQWMKQYARVYSNSTEKEIRFKIFKENVEYVESVNNGGNRTYKLSINEFSDLSHQEFVASRFGYVKAEYSSLKENTFFRYADVTDVPPNFDWREKGAVTNIKDQKSCGCCWAFSAVAAVEGITQITNGELNSFSEQELLDCDKTDQTQGCRGGTLEAAFEYIKANNGLSTETDYPYTAIEGTCNTQKTTSLAAKISGYETVPSRDEEALLKAVTQQPISVAIDGSSQDFKSYSSGVFNGECGTDLHHAVTIIGYGTDENGINYWLVKNSWGATWGEGGFGKFQRDVNVCGIAIDAVYPII